MERLINGVDGVLFQDIANSLIGGQNGNSDPYMVLADFEVYRKIQKEAAARYKDKIKWKE